MGVLKHDRTNGRECDGWLPTLEGIVLHVFDKTLLDLVERLKTYRGPEYSSHPRICTEAADFLTKLHKALVEHGDAYETEL